MAQEQWWRVVLLAISLVLLPCFIAVTERVHSNVLLERDPLAVRPRELTFAVPPNSVCPAIDLVYLWVNGTDPAVGAAVARLQGRPYVESGRLRDIPTLRYSMRAAATFAPFVRHFVLVTNGQVPAWLNASHPRVRVVTHAELFGARGALPTFNSNAIESQLAHIPGIAPCWFYQNDDFAFGRPVRLPEWIDLATGRQRLAFDSWRAPETKLMQRNIWHASVGYSNGLLNKFYYGGGNGNEGDGNKDGNGNGNENDDNKGKTKNTATAGGGNKGNKGNGKGNKNGNKGGNTPTTGETIHRHRYEGHNTRFFQQRYLELIEARWGAELERTAHSRFRQRNDTALPFLYNNVVLHEGGGVADERLRRGFMYNTFRSDAARVAAALRAFAREQPISWCLNDGAGVVDTPEKRRAYDAAVAALESILARWFPYPADFELHAPGAQTIPQTPAQYRALQRRLRAATPAANTLTAEARDTGAAKTPAAAHVLSPLFRGIICVWVAAMLYLLYTLLRTCFADPRSPSRVDRDGLFLGEKDHYV